MSICEFQVLEVLGVMGLLIFPVQKIFLITASCGYTFVLLAPPVTSFR
jgi:hypothetical protein